MPDVPAVTPLPVAWVDAFTDRAFNGNQCVVVFGADAVDDATRTAFTRETGLSECAFLQHSEIADIGVRYHTASGEIPMAGHPTIATVTALLDRDMVPLVDAQASFTLEVGAGVIPIEIDATGNGPARIAMQQLRPTFGAHWDPADIAPLLGLTTSDFRATPQTVSTGTPFLVSPLTDHDALRRAVLDVDALQAFHAANHPDFFEPFLTVMGGATPDGAGDVFSRLLLTPPEPPEDPFTGSATGCMAAWLWANGELASRHFLAHQGHDMGRPGRAEVTVLGSPDDIEGVRVAGTGVVVMRGEVLMPMSTPSGGGTGGAGGSGHLTPQITAADSGVAAFIGETEKNLDISHARITSMAEYESRFGSGGNGVAVATAVRQYFDNGGRSAIIAPATADRRSHAVARDALVDSGADLLVLPVDGATDLPRDLVESAVMWGEEHDVLVLVDPDVAWRSTDDAIVGQLPSSDHATIWFPRGKDRSGRPVTVTPAIAGVIARTDLTRGVWKTPAGTEANLRGVTAAVSLSREDAADLTAVNVNGVMTVRGTPVVWGARTTSLNPEWRYLAVRRTADWIARSITTSLQHDDAGLPADAAGMAAIANAVSVFLDGIHRQGGFQGAGATEAWFVRCDDTTTTPADIDLGRVNVHVGFAPTRPAEFIVIRIGLELDQT